jgi:hypothetical protein
LLAAFTRQIDAAENRHIQDEIGRSVVAFQEIAAEAKRERLVNLTGEPDPTALARTLLRLRHDLIIIGRSGIEPLPRRLKERLGPLLVEIGARASDYLLASANALTTRRSAPSSDPVEAALAAYAREMADIRNEGLTRTIVSGEVERVFALGFALQQLRENFLDLAGRVQDWALDRRQHSGSPEAATHDLPKQPLSAP